MNKEERAIRDKTVYQFFVRDKFSMEKIGHIFKITTGRVHQILKHQRVKDIISK